MLNCSLLSPLFSALIFWKFLNFLAINFFIGTFQCADEKEFRVDFNTNGKISTSHCQLIASNVKSNGGKVPAFSIHISDANIIDNSCPFYNNPIQIVQLAISRFCFLEIMAFGRINPDPIYFYKAMLTKNLPTSFYFSRL